MGLYQYFLVAVIECPNRKKCREERVYIFSLVLEGAYTVAWYTTGMIGRHGSKTRKLGGSHFHLHAGNRKRTGSGTKLQNLKPVPQ